MASQPRRPQVESLMKICELVCKLGQRDPWTYSYHKIGKMGQEINLHETKSVGYGIFCKN
jgi:hypothetical protein